MPQGAGRSDMSRWSRGPATNPGHGALSAHSNWAQEVQNDPLAVMKNVKTPILVLYGSDDPWVAVKTSVKWLASIKSAHPNLTVQVISGADHAMMTSLAPLAEVDQALMARQAPEASDYFAILARLLMELSITNSKER